MVAVVWIAGVAAGSDATADLHIFGLGTTTTSSWVFVIGVITGVVTMLFVGLLLLALRKDTRDRKQRKELERRRDELEAERDKVAEQLGERPEGAPDLGPSRFDPQP